MSTKGPQLNFIIPVGAPCFHKGPTVEHWVWAEGDPFSGIFRDPGLGINQAKRDPDTFSTDGHHSVMSTPAQKVIRISCCVRDTPIKSASSGFPLLNHQVVFGNRPVFLRRENAQGCGSDTKRFHRRVSHMSSAQHPYWPFSRWFHLVFNGDRKVYMGLSQTRGSPVASSPWFRALWPGLPE